MYMDARLFWITQWDTHPQVQEAVQEHAVVNILVHVLFSWQTLSQAGL